MSYLIQSLDFDAFSPLTYPDPPPSPDFYEFTPIQHPFNYGYGSGNESIYSSGYGFGWYGDGSGNGAKSGDGERWSGDGERYTDL
jgi:hypothetical protein